MNELIIDFYAPKADNDIVQPNNRTLGTLWEEKGLNSNLVAKIRPILESTGNEQGKETYSIIESEPTVATIFEEANFDIQSQYTTPFETSNPEGRMPNLMGLIQSGQMASAGYSFFQSGHNQVTEGMSAISEAVGVKESMQKGLEQLEALKGRSNFTKINSRQIFTSTESVRITGTVVFQAWQNAKAEVEEALAKLQQWALPVELSKTSLLVGVAKDEGFTKALFPSVIPPLVQLQYGGKTYLPLVIESISAPITAPMTPDGSRIAVKAQVTFLSLMAWDGNDVINLYK